MILKPGQTVEYWAGLGGSTLRESRIVRIEAALTLEPNPGLREFDTDSSINAFVDFEDGRWVYAARIERIVNDVPASTG